MSKQDKVYEIHDNGGRPFFVTIKGTTVSVSKNMSTIDLVDGEWVDTIKPPKHLFTVTADEYWIGKKSPKGGYDGLKPSKAEGNSILLKEGSTYIYIGHEIYSFSPVKGDTIVKYYSDIGNSDVPYPYAIGKTHIYIMLDKVAVEKSFFDLHEDIYHQYYYPAYVQDCQHGHGTKAICADKKVIQQRLKELKDKTTKLRVKILQKRAW